MNQSATLAEIAALSVEERIRLVEAIWESIAIEPERRLAAHVASPDEVVPWEEVKAQALARMH
jgi:putative addiction module component (TIGR02574 family)